LGTSESIYLETYQKVAEVDEALLARWQRRPKSMRHCSRAGSASWRSARR